MRVSPVTLSLPAAQVAIMLRRMLQAVQDPSFVDDRDYYGNKRLELAGEEEVLISVSLVEVCTSSGFLPTCSCLRANLPLSPSPPPPTLLPHGQGDMCLQLKVSTTCHHHPAFKRCPNRLSPPFPPPRWPDVPAI